MNARKHLLTHVFLSLAALPVAFQPAAAMNLPRPGLPQATHNVILAAMSVDEASRQVEEARRRLEEAKAQGGDVAGAEAALKAAEGELNAARQAGEKPPEPKPEPKQEPPKEEAPKAEAPKPQAEKPAEAPKEPVAEAPKPDAPEGEQRKHKQKQAPADAGDQAAPPADNQAEQPKPDRKKKPAEPAAEAPAATEPAAPAKEPAAKEPAAKAPAPAAEEPAAKPEAAPAPKQEAQPGDVGNETKKPPHKKPKPDAGDAPAADQPAKPEATPAPAQAPAPTGDNAQPPKDAAPKPAPGDGAAKSPAADQGQAAPAPDSAKPAPVLDSAKPAPLPDSATAPPANGAPADASQPQTANQPPAAAQPPAGKPQRPPKSDADAQGNGKAPPPPVKLEPSTAERGRPMDRRPDYDMPGDARVEGRVDGRDVLNFLGQLIVRGADADRFSRDGARPDYEELPGDRTREIIRRPDGSEIVTIRNRFGDVIQRSRFDRNGREIVLFYDPDLQRRPDRERVFRDPSLDLPPMQLDVPVDQYILDSSTSRDRDYYDFLRKPPVERVERVYSLDEVRYSARVRDKMPRIDLDTIHFATGSSDVSMNEAASLRNVADAMKRIIARNPAETFLIEGHTDAVGSDQSNLVLSDRRAESVAIALSDVFGIPPENLVTQGYGERYLKVQTLGPSAENRRVTIRRITALVRPANIQR